VFILSAAAVVFNLDHCVGDASSNELTLLRLVMSEHLRVDDTTADVAGLRSHIFVILKSKISRIFRNIPPLLSVLAPDFNAFLGGVVFLLGHIFL
jgi:hypothetical protein